MQIARSSISPRATISPRSLSGLSKPFGLDTLGKIRAARACVPEFEGFSETDFYVQPLKGGLTNLLWTVGVKSEALRQRSGGNGESNKLPKNGQSTTVALVREYGRGTESFMNRIQEERVVQVLSEQGLCPKVYGVSSWGRVEKFLEDSRTLLTAEYASYDYIDQVAELLGKFHGQSESLLKLCTSPGTESRLGARMEAWYDIAAKVTFDDDQDLDTLRKKRKLIALDMTKSIREEMAWLLEEIAVLNSPVVFSHCDLQEGNLLLHKGSLSMIDFEYSERFERGFDLGNCFCEMSIDYRVNNYPGFFIDPDMLPGDDKQIKFIQAYAKGAGLEWSTELKKQLLKEANVFVMGSHLHWVLWSVVQAGSSTIEFGYMEYAEQRMDQYYHCKRKWYELCERIDAM